MIIADFDGAQEFGAGIIVGRKKDELLIATAYHLLHIGPAQAKKIQVKFRANTARFLEADILEHGSEEMLDLALLSVKNLSKEGMDVCSVEFDRLRSSSSLKRGDDVFPLGNPNGTPWAMPVAPDKIADLLANDISFQSSFITRGHSGGALLDEDARITGMIIADQPPFGRAINIDSVISKIKQWGYPVQLRFKYENGWTPLHVAASKGDLAEIKNLMADCGEINQTDDHKATALHFAAGYGTPEAVALLISYGADLNALDADGDPPLEWAVEKDERETVKVLIKAGAKVEANSLRAAVDSGYVDLIKLACNSVTDINAEVPNAGYSYGHTLLTRAIMEGQLEIVKSLVTAGADVNYLSDENRTPLFEAAYFQHGGTIGMPQKYYQNLRAIEDFLIAHGAGFKGVKTEDIETLFSIVIEKNDIGVVKALLAAGFNPNTKHDGVPALVMASQYSNLEIVKVLIKAGADVNLADEYGETPLIKAAREGHPDIIKILIQSGANVNLKNHQDISPLAVLCYDTDLDTNIKLEIMKVLIDAGADVNVKDELNNTPLSLALKKGNDTIAKFLSENGAKE